MSNLSIIIPTYNSEQTLNKCLNSIFSQTHCDFDAFVIDGKSVDGTLKICMQYEEKFDCFHFISEPDQSVYDAMNKGIRMAKGEWLLFLGGDDILKDKNTLLNIFKHDITNFDIVYGDVEMLYCKQIYRGRTNLYQMLFEGNICHQAIIYNKRVFEILGNYNLEYPVYADYDLNIRCWKHSKIKIKYIPEIISVYNERDGLTGKNTLDNNFHIKREEERKAYLNTFKGHYEKLLSLINIVKIKTNHKLKQHVKNKTNCDTPPSISPNT